MASLTGLHAWEKDRHQHPSPASEALPHPSLTSSPHTPCGPVPLTCTYLMHLARPYHRAAARAGPGRVGGGGFWRAVGLGGWVDGDA